MLEILAEASGPLTIAELAATLGVHRSIAYRILRTPDDHSLVVRDTAGMEPCYATSHDEVIDGRSSVAAPVRIPGHRPAAVAVVYIRTDQDTAAVGHALHAAAGRIEAALG